MKTKPFFSIFVVVMIFCLFTVGANGKPVQAQSTVPGELADVVFTPNTITWTPVGEYSHLYLRIAAPGGEVFDYGESSTLGLTDPDGNRLADGLYRYELVVMPPLDAETLNILAQVTPENRDQTILELQQAGKLPQQSLTQSGAFYINNGSFAMAAVEGSDTDPVQNAQSTDIATPLDVVQPDDEIVAGSLCVGLDCLTDGSENFGYDTVKLKENNLQVYFDDTSLAGFPANDWRLVMNDSASGGSSYFTIMDATANRKLFTLEAGAPANSLYVDSTGCVGVGTSNPTEKLHVAGNVRVDGYIVEFSDANVKMGFLPVDGAEILQKLLDMPVTTWSYKAEGSQVVHMGPTAQDFYAAFGLGADNKHIAALDANGVSLAAIRELTRLSEAQDARITTLELQNADLEQRVEKLEKLVQELAEAQK
ncbi:hypothetical protein LARV_00432 [Longilinea arvoryzae]|uniref:Peptidase S74 domain-containing protein n=1 Tax=Longilinea arvoryzae TaxID=360412 RepID=A0A0S7BF60_9CHLR|nr:tail fiber domain-containing protein [Longilinea arvoryzae]GAP12696.1 hypothetical protein LARV_00432 [Longilinea arvoryzae]